MYLYAIGYICSSPEYAWERVKEALDYMAAGLLTDWEVLFTVRISAKYQSLTEEQASSLWAICVERRPRRFSDGISVAKTIMKLLRMPQYLDDMDREWLEHLQSNGIECLDIDGIERLSGIARYCEVDFPRVSRPSLIRTREDKEFVRAVARDLRRYARRRRRTKPCPGEQRGQRPSGGDLSALTAALDRLGAAVKADDEDE